MRKSVSPPISPKTIRHPKRSRQSSKSELSVEELSQDDLGYEGDVEVVRPDQYEEPESDFEEDKGPTRCITTIDEEITRGMKQLGWRQSQPRIHTGPVVQHLSEFESSPINRYGKRVEYDVTATVDGSNHAPPAKRRKKRDSRSSISQRSARTRPKQHTDSSDRTEDKRTPFADSSTGSTAASEAPQVASNDEMVLD